MKRLILSLNKCLCDYRCIFCSRGSTSYQRQLKNYLSHYDYRMSVFSFREILCRNYCKEKLYSLEIGGNEPLMHPHIIKLVDFARRVGYCNIFIRTTGQKFSNIIFAKEGVNAGMTEVDMPVYGAIASTHDLIVRKKGGFFTTLRAIDNLQKLGIKVCLHTLILKQNIDEICQIQKKFEGIEVRYPRPFSGDILSYKKICVRFSDLSKEIKRMCYFDIPCLDKNETSPVFKSDIQEVTKFREDNPLQKVNYALAEKKHRIKLFKCRQCSRYHSCKGIYPFWVHFFGEEEFRPIG